MPLSITKVLSYPSSIVGDKMKYLSLVGDIAGFVAFGVGLLTYMSLDRRRILGLKFTGDFLWFLNFVCLGGYTGAILNLIAMGREVVFYLRGKKRFASHIAWLPVFLALTLLSPVIEYAALGSFDPLTVFPTVGSMLLVVGLYQEDTNRVRYFSFGGMCLWLIYSLSIQNISALISNIIALVSITIGIVRYFALEKYK